MKLSATQEKILTMLSNREAPTPGNELRLAMRLSYGGFQVSMKKLLVNGLVRFDGTSYTVADDWREKLYRKEHVNDLCGIAFALAGGKS